jgi:NADH:ubiquinone oxidoreductase subunit K
MLIHFPPLPPVKEDREKVSVAITPRVRRILEIAMGIEVVFGGVTMALLVVAGFLVALEADNQVLIFFGFVAAGGICIAVPLIASMVLFAKEPEQAALIGGIPSVLALLAVVTFFVH